MYKNTNNHRWLIPFTASRFTGRGLWYCRDVPH
jgi:hypothetical protein